MHEDNQDDCSLEPTANNAYQDQPFIDNNKGEEIWAELESTSKHWATSKTMWFNIGVTAIGVSQAILPFAQPFVNPRTFGLLTTAIGVANLALRTVTKDEIKPNE